MSHWFLGRLHLTDLCFAAGQSLLGAHCGSPGRHPKCPFSDGGADLQVGLAVTADSVHCSTMVALLINLIRTLRSALHTRAELALENLALRQQLANLRRP